VQNQNKETEHTSVALVNKPLLQNKIFLLFYFISVGSWDGKHVGHVAHLRCRWFVTSLCIHRGQNK